MIMVKIPLNTDYTWNYSFYEWKDLGVEFPYFSEDEGALVPENGLDEITQEFTEHGSCETWEIGLSQAAYIDKVLARFNMLDSNKWLYPFRHGVPFTNEQCPKTHQEEELRRVFPYTSNVGSLMYAMLCIRIDICFAVGMVSIYQLNPRPPHWVAGEAYTQVSSENEGLYACLPL
jgi:hypothetical protein